jgi:hypothetical protein
MDIDLRRPLLIAAIGALSLTALIAIIALLAGNFGDTELRILATTGGFGLSSLLATRGTALLEQRRYVALGRTVAAASALSFLCLLWILWIDDDSEAAWKSYVCTIAIAAALAQIAGMLSSARSDDPPSIRPLILAAGATAALVAGLACGAALGEISRAGYYRIFGVLVVLDAFLVALQPVVRRLGSGKTATASRLDRFTLVFADGRRVEHHASTDLPESVAQALRGAPGHVTRIELGDG